MAETLSVTIALPKKGKRFRSSKCDICEHIKKDVETKLCPMTYYFDGVLDDVTICKSCYDIAIKEYGIPNEGGSL